MKNENSTENVGEPQVEVSSTDWLAEVNHQRDKVATKQEEGPDGLKYPILSLCCFYAQSERIHRLCLQRLCACPCHTSANASNSAAAKP